ncbi:MAG: hypothetical protein NXI31_19975 [bacterium]|nr:hypothetical protein [bacterium]
MSHALDLRSPRWSELRHAYGGAADTPDRLRQVLEDPLPKADTNAEPWFSLWSSLCHQGDIYPASFAAVPHIVRAGLAAEQLCAFDVLALPEAIETQRLRAGEAPPAELAEAYRNAIQTLPTLVAQQARFDWDETFTRVAAAAIAAAKGHADLATGIGDLDPPTLARFLDDHG